MAEKVNVKDVVVAPTIITVDGSTYMAVVSDNVVKNAYPVAGKGEMVSREEMFDFLEMSLIGTLPTFNLNPNTPFITRDMNDAEVMNWTIVQATYNRADQIKDQYLVTSTVKAIKGMLG